MNYKCIILSYLQYYNADQPGSEWPGQSVFWRRLSLPALWTAGGLFCPSLWLPSDTSGKRLLPNQSGDLSLVQIRRDTVLSLVEIPTYHSVFMAISEREWFTLFQISAQILGFIANRVLCFCEYLIHFSLLVLWRKSCQRQPGFWVDDGWRSASA